MMQVFAAFLLLCTVAAAHAQDPKEGALSSDIRREREALSSTCGAGLKGAAGCAQNLFMDHPLHIAVGSIAPQNGVGAGLAFAYEQNTKSTRLKWNADAVASSSAAWRAGAYLKLIPTPNESSIVISTDPNVKPSLAVVGKPLFNVYVQGISLPNLLYFGLGNRTSVAGRSYYGMSENIVGLNGVVPLFQHLGFTFFGEANGRFVDIRSNHSHSSPSIEQLYTPVTAPGLDDQPAFFQLGEGLRFRHSFQAVRTRLDYSAALQEFIAPGKSGDSFRRLNLDFDHEYAIYRRQAHRTQNENQGPDDCRDHLDQPCPKVSFTRDLEGTLRGRILITQSIASAGHVVPFYFQPTLGGSDINGQTTLPSYADYRFRGPNLFLVQGSFEHVIWGPFGFIFGAEGGKVGLKRSDIGFDHFAHSFSTGFTIRAGALPAFTFRYAWGGNEGNHTTALLSPTLLGASSRPSLH